MEPTESVAPGSELTDAYLAGYIDGEGCIRDGNNGSISVSITNTYLPTLKDIQAKWGGSIQDHATGPNCRTAWMYRVQGSEAAAMLEAILPFLWEKKQQAELLLEAMHYPYNSSRRQAIRKQLAALKRVDHYEEDHLHD